MSTSPLRGEDRLCSWFARPSGSLTGERGAGVIGAAFGVAVFVLFLFFTVQLLVNLFFISSVTSAAHDAAAAAAHSGSAPPSAAVLREAEDDFRRSLGTTGQGADVQWDTANPDFVELHVRVPYPDLALSDAGLPFFETLDRRIRVRVEQLQD